MSRKSVFIISAFIAIIVAACIGLAKAADHPASQFIGVAPAQGL